MVCTGLYAGIIFGDRMGASFARPKLLAPLISWYSSRSNMFILNRCSVPVTFADSTRRSVLGLVAAIEPARGAVLVCGYWYRRDVLSGP